MGIKEGFKGAETTAGQGEYVFCTRDGTPLDTTNVARRVWYALYRMASRASTAPNVAPVIVPDQPSWHLLARSWVPDDALDAFDRLI